MKTNQLKYLFTVALLSLAAVAPAHATIPGTDFGVTGSVLWGVGSYANSTGTIQSRTMNTLAIQALPGYNIAGFLVGPLAEFRMVGQLTDPATVSGTNTKGTGYLVGVGASYSLTMFDFTGGFNFVGQYSQSNADAFGNKITNKKPIGFVLQAGYRFMPGMSADVRFDRVSYGTDSVGGVDSDVSTNKRTQTNFSAGVSYHL